MPWRCYSSLHYYEKNPLPTREGDACLGHLFGGSMKVLRSIMHQIPCPEAVKTIVQKLKEIEIRKPASRLFEGKKAPWKKRKRVSSKDISFGHHMVEKCGSVVVQKGKVGLSEVWLFGAFDQQTGDGVVRFLRSHLFLQSHPHEEQLSEKQITRKAMQAMKNAYYAATSSMQPHESGGSVSALLVNGKRLVTADFGGYRAVMCRGGKAVQLGNRRQLKTDMRLRSLNVISGKLFGRSAVHEDENKKKSLVDAEKLGSKTDFIILASCGVWEVMGNQEAVSLVRHIEDPQEAAKCLADEAVARMTKSAVVCEIIRIKVGTRQ
ncbi:hypothetical protein Taro_018891 [Colocasia esculenta]|uniref:protein-serine/threonine phosphatase n=1 Tax=Colocasia esculenta TaxID=4460 RepID=A0A843US95_COLES|nr:hypothetical protein [Colocasia esculenta]